jgi:muramoyltetrapeptide carboxypeptidase
MKFIRPQKLSKNDLIGLISPASPPDEQSVVERGVRYLEKLGYNVEVGKHVGKVHGYLAGNDEERVEDLHYMFRSKNVKAIICVRGGYGASRLLNKIDFKIIKANPKIFVGYSEITALQSAILEKTGLITFAGPMIYPDLFDEVSSFTEEFFWKVITSNKKIGRVEIPEQDKIIGMTKGSSSGKIVGGNLSVLNALIGTQFFPNLKDKILLLEDIKELPYKIDRMLNHFQISNSFKNLRGIILGRFVDCFEHDPMKKTLTLGEVMENYLSNMKIPIVYAFPHGHIKDKITIPIGLKIRMNATKGFVEFMESAVK